MAQDDYPLVSIMISAWNQSDVLPTAIQSALEQDYSNLEIIVSDDASGDKGWQGLQDKFPDHRIRWIVQPENLGRAGNYRSLLYNLAKGKYVSLLNGDDYFCDKRYVSEAVTLLQEDLKIQLVFGEVDKLIVKTGKHIRDTYHEDLPGVIDGNQFFFDYPDKGYSIPHVSSIYRRERAIEIDFYRISTMSQDWESLLRIIMNAKIGYVSRTVAIKRQHADNVTKTKELHRFEDNEAWMESVRQFGNEQGLDLDSLNRWEYKMMKRHHIKWLIKMEYLAPEKLSLYHSFLEKKHPELFSEIKSSFKMKAFHLLKHSNFLMRLIFRYVIRQESFILDLQEHQTKT
jgi:glycosyltransferase involved in cell wall biosynthesis